METNNPSFQNFYGNLFENYLAKEEEEEEIKEKETSLIIQNLLQLQKNRAADIFAAEEEQLPLIDLSRLNSSDFQSVEECKREIVEASKEWGFFQVVNHGISNEMFEKMLDDQVKAFRKPFDVKANESDSYRWGTQTAAKRMNQFSWSEAFHIPLANISNPRDHNDHHFNTLRLTIDEFAPTVSSLAQKIAEILEENLLGYKSPFFENNCSSETSYLRLNRYPPCPISSSGVSGVDVFGLMPHTDSDFLTVLYQDEVGGLQLVKDGRWLTVKPNPEALIINIGDLFQAWSNGVYRSVEHRVVTNKQVERFSTAYFLCPSYDSVILSCSETPIYREFSFREFRRQVQEDVKTLGYKVGLPRFLL